MEESDGDNSGFEVKRSKAERRRERKRLREENSPADKSRGKEASVQSPAVKALAKRQKMDTAKLPRRTSSFGLPKLRTRTTRISRRKRLMKYRES